MFRHNLFYQHIDFFGHELRVQYQVKRLATTKYSLYANYQK